MEKNKYFIERVVCLLSRKQNKKFIQRNGKKKGYNVDINNCEKSDFYMNLKETLNKYRLKKENILFFDDRIQFLLNPVGLFEPPVDWEILFLNGRMISLGKKIDSKYYSTGEVKDSTCIVINKTVKDRIKNFKLENFEESLNQLKCYSLKNTFAVDNEKAIGLDKIVTPEHLDTLPVHYSTNNLKLKIDEIRDTNLPMVSLITPINSITPKLRKLFFFTVMNFYKLDYPKDKIEWIIADDTPTGESDQITDLLPGEKDNRIKVIKCDVKTGRTHRLSMGKKLNICANYANSKYILHFFEFNYYPENSIRDRINALLHLNTKMCVGSTKVGIYNFIENCSYTLEEKDKMNHPIILYEPSLAYHKLFWELRPFNEYLLNDHVRNICVIPWCDNRYNLLLDIPYDFTCTKLEMESAEVQNDINLSENWNPKLQETLQMCKGDYLS